MQARRLGSLPTCCPGFYGYSHLTGGIAGGQAEYTRVLHGELLCFGMSGELPCCSCKPAGITDTSMLMQLT